MVKYAFLLLFLIVFAGCAQQDPDTTPKKAHQALVYRNPVHGFSFSYPSSWELITKDEPDRVALLDPDDNAILVLVENASSNNLVTLGMQQAATDYYPTVPSPQELQRIVRRVLFDEKGWYTYAITFEDKGIDSIVSGTLCGDKEVKGIVVSQSAAFPVNRELYFAVLSTFTC